MLGNLPTISDFIRLLTKYHLGNQIKKNGIGRACGVDDDGIHTGIWLGDLRERN
jgi:hypothetical protein